MFIAFAMGTSDKGRRCHGMGLELGAGSLIWPMLSKSNYQEWSTHVHCNLEAMYLWDAIELEDVEKVERCRDRLALEAMMHGVPLRCTRCF